MKNYIKKIEKPTVIIMAGSDSDIKHINKIKDALVKYDLPSQVRICSAHKQANELVELIKEYNKCKYPILIVGVAGGTDALSGTASFHSVFPVVSCPPEGLNESCLMNPPGSSNAFIKRPENVAKFAAQLFSVYNENLKSFINSQNQEKIQKLQKADLNFNS